MPPVDAMLERAMTLLNLFLKTMLADVKPEKLEALTGLESESHAESLDDSDDDIQNDEHSAGVNGSYLFGTK